MARASPSIGAYRDSAPLLNLEPASVIRQPSAQHAGDAPAQWQVFCSKWYPRPSLDQSVRRQVGNMGSKISTPRSIALMILIFDALKAESNSAVHRNGVLEERR